MSGKAANARSGTKGFVRIPLEQRFWSHVVRGAPDECWPWNGSNDPREYGSIWVDGKRRKASQISWELANGRPFPPNTMACHTCDNPPCVNPAHIWPGSMSDNILDSVSKGRFVKHQAMKTHCPRGHAYTAGNIYWSKTGGRHCMECHRMHLKSWRARRRAALNPTEETGR